MKRRARGKAQLAALARDVTQEQMLDAAMGAIAREVLEKTLEGQDPATQKAATRLLLKRAEQHRFDRRMTFTEAGSKVKNKKTPGRAAGESMISRPTG